MRDRTILLELFLEIEEALERIQWRFEGITSAEDFVRDRNGLDRLDGIGMMLIAIGENLRRIDAEMGNVLAHNHPNIDWLAVKGLRNILAHNYFSIDAEEVYQICLNEIKPLKQALAKVRSNLT